MNNCFLYFLSFKELTQAYLVKTSTSHDKYLKPRFLEDNDTISVKSAAQILSLNLIYSFPLFNFLITGLSNSSASSSLTLTPSISPVFFIKKTYGRYLLNLFDIHHI